jgi:hypothetical protein
MATAGYSTNSLAKKLGIKEDFEMLVINQPSIYSELIKELKDSIHFNAKPKKNLDFVHFFTNSLNEFETQLPKLKQLINPNGMIWVSWYKKAAKKPTDLTEDIIRDTALAIGLVDIKVCAIDEEWSGLKLVIPVKDR